jgi:hypothetical protein
MSVSPSPSGGVQDAVEPALQLTPKQPPLTPRQPDALPPGWQNLKTTVKTRPVFVNKPHVKRWRVSPQRGAKPVSPERGPSSKAPTAEGKASSSSQVHTAAKSKPKLVPETGVMSTGSDQAPQEVGASQASAAVQSATGACQAGSSEADAASMLAKKRVAQQELIRAIFSSGLNAESKSKCCSKKPRPPPGPLDMDMDLDMATHQAEAPEQEPRAEDRDATGAAPPKPQNTPAPTTVPLATTSVTAAEVDAAEADASKTPDNASQASETPDASQVRQVAEGQRMVKVPAIPEGHKLHQCICGRTRFWVCAERDKNGEDYLKKFICVCGAEVEIP